MCLYGADFCMRITHYYAFRPRKKPYLRPHHKTARLRWARIYRDLELGDWALVGFSDESTFELGISTSPPWARRKIGEAYDSVSNRHAILKQFKYIIDLYLENILV